MTEKMKQEFNTGATTPASDPSPHRNPDQNAVADRFAEDLAKRLIEEMKKGTSPYQKPWTTANFVPYNPLTGTRYRGANNLRLLLENRERPEWMTMQQINNAGGRVKKGEHGVRCFFYAKKRVPITGYETADGYQRSEPIQYKDVTFPCPFTVFNIDQTEGLDESKLIPQPKVQFPMDRTAQLIDRSGAVIESRRGDASYYSPAEDKIVVPLKAQFINNAAYFDTLLHELGHWTGHESRLGRFKVGHIPAFGTADYAREEMRAETASLIIASSIGLPHSLKRHADYVGRWVTILENDPHEILWACTDAEKIADYVLQYDLHRSYILDFTKEAAYQVENATLVKQAEVLIDENHLADMTFQELVQRRLDKGFKRRDSEMAVTKHYLSPTTNAEKLQKAGLKGIEISDSPMEILCIGKSVGGTWEKAAERLAVRVLGESRLGEVNRVLQSDEWLQSQKAYREILIPHFDAVRKSFPSIEEKFTRAPGYQQERVLVKAQMFAQRKPTRERVRAEGIQLSPADSKESSEELTK